MADMAWQHVVRRGAFSQVVREAGEAHGERGLQMGCHVQHHHQVHTGVHLGVVLGALGYAPQALDLGQHHGQRATVAQHVEHARGLRLHEPARQLLPHALGHQVVGLAVVHHLAHELHRLGRHGEVGETRRKARHAQDAHRVLAEGVGHMAQYPRLQVARAAIRVKQVFSARPVSAGSYCIDSKVAP